MYIEKLLYSIDCDGDLDMLLGSKGSANRVLCSTWAMSPSWRASGSLTALDLSVNKLKDEGVSAVCEAIQSNKETTLSSLNFGYNGIGPVGANAVAAMVAATGSGYRDPDPPDPDPPDPDPPTPPED